MFQFLKFIATLIVGVLALIFFEPTRLKGDNPLEGGTTRDTLLDGGGVRGGGTPPPRLQKIVNNEFSKFGKFDVDSKFKDLFHTGTNMLVGYYIKDSRVFIDRYLLNRMFRERFKLLGSNRRDTRPIDTLLQIQNAIDWARKKNLPVPDTYMMVNIADHPFWEAPPGIPIMTYARPMGMKAPLIPDTSYLGFSFEEKYGAKALDWDQAKALVEKKVSEFKGRAEPVAYFRGAMTGELRDRLRILVAGYVSPLIKFEDSSKLGYEPVWNWLQYKYFLNLPGHYPWSNRLKYLYLLKRPIIDIDVETKSYKSGKLDYHDLKYETFLELFVPKPLALTYYDVERDGQRTYEDFPRLIKEVERTVQRLESGKLKFQRPRMDFLTQDFINEYIYRSLIEYSHLAVLKDPPSGPTRVLILLPNDSLGLRKDAELLVQYLGAENPSIVIQIGKEYVDSDLVIIVEQSDIVLPQVRTWFLVNEEFFETRDGVELYICKTHSALQMLKQMGLNAVYIGFTSPIPISKKVDHRNKKIIHIGGSSPFKGTDLVLETWEKWGDELPPLKVVCRQQCLKNLLKWKPNARVIKNVEIVDEWLEDSEMWSMKLDHSIHLCPSLAEGFGHTINEARALGALVLCTDAPPMNELITPDSGILIPVNTTVDRKNLVSKNYMVSPQGIKDAVLKAWDMTTVQRAELGDKAYRDFILETEAFKLEIKKLARQIY